MPLTFALQALLLRHEAYVADSERERHQMMDTIERLESEKLALEAKNAQTIKANRDLLDQLEQLPTRPRGEKPALLTRNREA